MKIVVDNYIDQLYKSKNIPYYHVVAYDGRNKVYERLNDGGDENLKIFAYSCTKPLTAVCISQLIERGKLSPSDRLCDYLPEYKNAFVLGKNGEKIVVGDKITIENLLTMTAGLTYDVRSEKAKTLIKSLGENATTREIAGAFAKMPLAFVPGEKFLYSLCMDVLAAVAEVVSGVKFSEFAEENVFEPLSMRDSGFSFVPSELKRQFKANADGSVTEVAKENELILSKNYESGGAGLITTVDDFCKFAVCLTLGGESIDGRRILKEESVKRLALERVRKISVNSGFTCVQGEDYGYGYGVRVRQRDTDFGLKKGEFGWDGAAGTYFECDPAKKITVVIGMHLLEWPNDFMNCHLAIVKKIYEEII